MKTKIRVRYNDETVGEYPGIPIAETEILERFNSEDVTPDYIERLDSDGKQLSVYSCQWSVQIVPPPVIS